MFLATYLNALGDPQNSPHPKPPGFARHKTHQAALALYGTEPFHSADSEILRRLVLPFLHSESSLRSKITLPRSWPVRNDPGHLVESNPMKVTHEVKHGRGGE